MMEIESIGKASGMVYGRYIYFFLLFLPHLPFSSMEGRSNITSANKIYIVAKPPCQHLEKQLEIRRWTLDHIDNWWNQQTYLLQNRKSQNYSETPIIFLCGMNCAQKHLTLTTHNSRDMSM